MTIEDLKNSGLIILECISGSKAYGLDTPSSDTDIKGVFILPKKMFYAGISIPQISNETNDIVYYEFGRYMELLSYNNPNILELLNSPEDVILHKNEVLNQIDSRKIISKNCKNSFGKFAVSQIRKARGLNKKIVNPVDKVRKTILDFCFVNFQKGSIALKEYLESLNVQQEDCGLVKITHMHNVYGLYHQSGVSFKGIMAKENANDVALSSVPKEFDQKALLYFNREGYSTYCKEYKSYWEWVENRNEDRYKNNIQHGKEYDSKNMMHTFRLLNMAIEIALEKQIIVRRKDREFLLKVKSGDFAYADLMEMADQKQKEIEVVYETSSLRAKPDIEYIRELTFEIRDALYREMF